MNDLNRNTRTMIISFAVAVMAMIPLRFVEAGSYREALVLGATEEEAVRLPEIPEAPEFFLEAPYDQIEIIGGEVGFYEEMEEEAVEPEEITVAEGPEAEAVLGATDQSNCISQEDGLRLLEEIELELSAEGLDEATFNRLLEDSNVVKGSLCR